MWMNVPRIHVRTVQSAPIHMETIIARAAVLSLERTVMWVRKLLIFRLHSSLGLFNSSRMNTWGSMVLPQEGCNSIHNNLPYSLCFVSYLEWSGRIHWFLSCTGLVLFIILEVCPWRNLLNHIVSNWCVLSICYTQDLIMVPIGHFQTLLNVSHTYELMLSLTHSKISVVA